MMALGRGRWAVFQKPGLIQTSGLVHSLLLKMDIFFSNFEKGQILLLGMPCMMYDIIIFEKLPVSTVYTKTISRRFRKHYSGDCFQNPI